MPQSWDRISLLKNVQMNANKAGIGFCYSAPAIYTGDIMKITYINHSGFLGTLSMMTRARTVVKVLTSPTRTW